MFAHVQCTVPIAAAVLLLAGCGGGVEAPDSTATSGVPRLVADAECRLVAGDGGWDDPTARPIPCSGFPRSTLVRVRDDRLSAALAPAEEDDSVGSAVPRAVLVQCWDAETERMEPCTFGVLAATADTIGNPTKIDASRPAAPHP